MKHILFTTIATVILVGCSPKAPDISIHDAAEKGNIEAIKQHIAAGTEVNVKDDALEWTPLFIAAAWGHKEVIELLIANGADVNATDDGGKTPLDEATHPDNPNASAEIADLLRKNDGKAGEQLKSKVK